MNRLISLALPAIALASPSVAQDRMTLETCTQSLAAVEALAGLPDSTVEITANDEGWCLIENRTVMLDGVQGYTLASLRWRASGVNRLIDDGLPPSSFEVIGEGLSISPNTGDPVLDYLMGLQSAAEQTGFGLSVRWDGVQNAVFVDEAYFDFNPDNRIEFTARIDDVDLTDIATIQSSVGSMGLRDFSMKADFAGWFESFVALPLGTQLLEREGTDPAAQVTQLQEQSLTFLEEVPVAILPQASRDNLAAFIQSLPTPRGELRLQLSASPTLSAARMAPFALMPSEPSMEQIVDLGLEGVTLLFTWTPMGE